LSLLALGAASVTAVDVEPAQLHLTALKLAAVLVLPRERALRFLGYQSATKRDRREDLRAILPHLSTAAANFWSDHERVALAGVIWQGRFERYVKLLMAVVEPALGARVTSLFEARTLDEQCEIFDAEIGRPFVRGLFRVAFDPRVFGRRGMDPRSLAHRTDPRPVGERYFERFRAFCTSTPARENHLLQLTLLGKVRSPDAVPSCFSERGVAQLRARADRLRLVHGDVGSVLRAEDTGAFDKIQLSNLADWLSAPEFEELLWTVSRRIARRGRLCWRALHAHRDVPTGAELRVDHAMGERLGALDRYPFYRVVPVAVMPS
jgi:S-adenosylmethionine-diacylglycerol 3-amino-3-carboxypropyl transferase